MVELFKRKVPEPPKPEPKEEPEPTPVIKTKVKGGKTKKLTPEQQETNEILQEFGARYDGIVTAQDFGLQPALQINILLAIFGELNRLNKFLESQREEE